MAHELHITQSTNRKETYTQLIPQVKALLEGENNLVANLANMAAALKEAFDFFWVGFYLVQDGELVLGPFQGPVACTRISRGKGVCGSAWEKRETLIVPNVDEFPGHIACNSASKSEIVLPLIDSTGNVWGVLDVDSDKLSDFDHTDGQHLNELIALLNPPAI